MPISSICLACRYGLQANTELRLLLSRHPAPDDATCPWTWQLFNCVEQSDVHAEAPLAGSTRLADGLFLADWLLRKHPETFAFFCRAQLPFHHLAGDVHMRHTAPVFRVDPLTGEVVSVRFNETDRAPLNTLCSKDIEHFYDHAHVLERGLAEIEICTRLEQGARRTRVGWSRVRRARVGWVQLW